MSNSKVISKNFLTPNTFTLKVEKGNFKITAGQCFNLGLIGEGVNREYSIYSSADSPYLEFLIRKMDGGLVSDHLSKLSTGDYIEVDGPYGEFCLNLEDLENKFVFIASGTGIAPFHSFINTYPNLDYLLVHGVRLSEETYESQSYAPDRYIPCISKNQIGPKQRVTDFLKNNSLPIDARYYLCGNRNMIVDSVDLLLESGISGDQIITEVFF